MKYYDNTRIKDFRKCPRYFYFRHVRNWKSDGVSLPLAFGSAWHAGMDMIWADGNVDQAIWAWRERMQAEGINFNDPTFNLEDYRNEGTAKEMFTNYLKQHGNFIKSVKLLGIEQPFAVPLTEHGDIFYVGRWDKLIELKDNLICIEHKTTSEYNKGGPFKVLWMESFSPNTQIDGYLFGGHLTYGDKFKSVWVDGALVHKTIHDGFKFLPFERQFEMLDAWLWETRTNIANINQQMINLEEYRAGKELPFLPAFPKDTDRCRDFWKSCEFKGICRFVSNPEHITIPQGLVEQRWEPFNELELERIGLEEEV